MSRENFGKPTSGKTQASDTLHELVKAHAKDMGVGIRHNEGAYELAKRVLDAKSVGYKYDDSLAHLITLLTKSVVFD